MFNINGLYTNIVAGIQQFLGANPAAGRPNGTQITDDWCNDVQGELLNILAAAVIAPAPYTPTQVLQALRVLFTTPAQLAAAVTGVATAESVGAEAARAEAEEGILQENINNEAGYRSNADVNLQDQINAISTGLAPNGFGWSDVTGSRGLGATYTNTSGASKAVSVCAGSSSAFHIVLYVNGGVISHFGTGNGNDTFTVFGIVPNGATYEVAITAGSASLDNWLETYA